MTDHWRCFVGVPIGEALRAALAASVDAWRRQPPAEDLRWVEPQSWHLTLAFLGSVPAGDVDAASRAVAEVAGRHRPTRLETGRLGAFHRPGSVRTLWYGVSDPNGTLAELARDLGSVLGLEVETPYRPHITLARARQRPVDLRGWIEAASLEAPSGVLDVVAVELVRSHLGGGPARYETLASVALGGSS